MHARQNYHSYQSSKDTSTHCSYIYCTVLQFMQKVRDVNRVPAVQNTV